MLLLLFAFNIRIHWADDLNERERDAEQEDES